MLQRSAVSAAPASKRVSGVAPARPQQQHADGVKVALASGLAALQLALAPASFADFRLPPLSNDPGRCERGYVGNTIGQANAVSDVVLDLRKCVYKGKSLAGKTLAGALLSETDLSDTDLREAVFTKSYAVGANFENADMTNAVVDRVVFDGANLKGVQFINAVITGTSFEGADLTNTVWEDALIGNEDVKRLCLNPTLTGESRLQVGCRK